MASRALDTRLNIIKNHWGGIIQVVIYLDVLQRELSADDGHHFLDRGIDADQFLFEIGFSAEFTQSVDDVRSALDLVVYHGYNLKHFFRRN